MLRRALVPAHAPAVAVYAGVNVLAKGLAYSRPSSTWERDESARLMAAGNRAAPIGSDRPEQARVCYVTSHYPALSHTFVMREILGLRAAGVHVDTVRSIKPTAPACWPRPTGARPNARGTFSRSKLNPLSGRTPGAVLTRPAAYFRVLGEALRAAPGGIRGYLWQLFYFAEAIALWDHAKRLGARHLHAHLANVAADICWWASAFGNSADRAKNWRWSFTMHGPTELFSVERFNLARKVAHADLVVCISDFTRSQLMYLTEPDHWAKLHVVHCGADLSRYPLEPPRMDRASWSCLWPGWPPRRGWMCCSAPSRPIAESGVDVQLVLVGEGPLRERLRRRAQRLGITDQVVLAGAVGQDEMAGYYAGADVFCLPSFAEGVPVVLMEAMASGRAVVATRIAGSPNS